MLGAGGLLTPGKVIGRNELWVGAPAKLLRVMSDEERQKFDRNAVVYRELAAASAPDCAAPPSPIRKRYAIPASWSQERECVVFHRSLAILVCLVIAGCTPATPPPDTAVLPFAAFGTMDNDVAAANQAAWAFASPERIANNPVDAARAARNRLSGRRTCQQSALGRDFAVDQTGDAAARFDVRRSSGLSPCQSQVVVNALLRFAGAWQAGDQAAAVQALRCRALPCRRYDAAAPVVPALYPIGQHREHRRRAANAVRWNVALAFSPDTRSCHDRT